MLTKNNSFITRGNLIRLFDELSQERIIYVCAPAGFGKTSAVRQWTDRLSKARAVIALDERDNNYNHFCEQFCAAMRSCLPQNKTLEDIVSHPAFSGAPDEFTLRAIAAISKRKSMVFVIDDLHIIHDEKVLGLLLVFLKRLPENCRIILISLNDLPPGFSDLWIRGVLKKVEVEQLRFSAEEVAALYAKRGHSITSDKAAEICRFTNGWPIGINALLLSGGEPTGESFEYLEEFIRQNIWDNWNESTREFMLCTCVADELDPDLSAVLSGVPESAKTLRRLMQSGAFVFQTSDGVYHYHHLFHDFLRNMLRERGDGFLYPLLEKEGHWHLSRQDFYSAANCFLRCKNHDGIAKCFDLLEVADRNDFVIEKMLPIVKNAEINEAANTYPFLYYMMAWAAFVEGRAQDMSVYMDKYYARFPEIAQRDPAHAHNVFYLRILDFRANLKDLISELSALSDFPKTDGVRGSITMNMPLLHRSSRDFSELAGENTEANIGILENSVHWILGEESRVIICSLAAGLLYEQGHMEKAYVYALTANAEAKPHFSPELKFCASSILIRVMDAMGDSTQADRSLRHLEATIETDKAYYLIRNFRAFATRRKLANGDAKAAAEWLAEHEATPYEALSCFDMYGAFTTCRAYITVGNYDSAIILLSKALNLVTTFNRPLGTIETHILLAVAYWKKKRNFQESALQHLESAASIAYKYGYTQMFINESTELTGMLRRLQKRVEQSGNPDAPPASFIKKLYMNAMVHHGGRLTSGQPEKPEKYTDKQKAVMKLLCDGKSYREMTEILGIKLPTLRSHIALIYKKLDVTCGADAITKIKLQGILNDEG